MLLKEIFSVKAPIQEVWSFLLNPETIGQCIPGCEKIELIDDKTFLCRIRVKVSFISFNFNIKVNIIEMDQPNYLKSAGKGEDQGKAGNFSQHSKLNLRIIRDNETEVCYESNVSIVGRLATLGQKIIAAKATQLQKEFIQSVKQRLEQQ